MSRTLAAVALLAPALALAQASSPARPSLEEVEKDLLAQRADVIAKNLGLSADQAAKFWPLYEKYQAELAQVVDAQLKGVKAYAQAYDTLDDAAALAFANAQIDRDASAAALRKRWLPEFQKVLSGKVAARFMQLDRRISLLTQLEVARQVPLIR
jgi:Spy/CpxP family protein refolding chaperone